MASGGECLSVCSKKQAAVGAFVGQIRTQTRFELLTIEDVCQELGMGKSWVYKRLKSAEIRSVKLGHNIKVKREDLEQYLENNRNQPSGEEG